MFVDEEQAGKHVDCALPIKGLSVMSRLADRGHADWC